MEKIYILQFIYNIQAEPLTGAILVLGIGWIVALITNIGLGFLLKKLAIGQHYNRGYKNLIKARLSGIKPKIAGALCLMMIIPIGLLMLQPYNKLELIQKMPAQLLLLSSALFFATIAGFTGYGIAKIAGRWYQARRPYLP